jgi:serine/threonine protein kinase/tetratricopeptide (TPR) repeat protein
MPTQDKCPDNQLYLRLLRGELALFEVELVTSHLEQCPSCEKTVEELSGEDALLNEARAARLQQSGETGIPRGLIEQWYALSSQMTPVVTTINQDTPLGDRPEHYQFLAPGDRPDEIGRLGPYRVLGVLGAGGMGVVFQAEDVLLGRLVALKAIRPTLAVDSSTRERFLREARAMAAVKHDHIATMYQVGEDRGIPYMAMEFLEGETLESRVSRVGILSPIETVRIGREIAEGLAAAHARGLIHRDIKPTNIWLERRTRRDRDRDCETGRAESQTSEWPAPAAKQSAAAPGSPETDSFRVKILDFGLARAVSGDTDLTQTGAVLGTPAYMPPEQAEGEGVDGRADLYSLGCVLYRACTGKLPFAGKSKMAIWQAQALRDPTPPAQVNPAVPVELSKLILKLLARRVEDRPGSALEVAQALESLEGRLGQLGAEVEQQLTRMEQVDAPSQPRPALARSSVAEVNESAALPQSHPEVPRFQRRRSFALRGRWLPSARTVRIFATFGALVLVVGLGATQFYRLRVNNSSQSAEPTEELAYRVHASEGTQAPVPPPEPGAGDQASEIRSSKFISPPAPSAERGKGNPAENPQSKQQRDDPHSAQHFIQVATDNARSGNWPAVREALASLEKLAKKPDGQAGGLWSEKAPQFLTQVIEPAIRAERQWVQDNPQAPERRKQFAQLCALRGHLIYDHLDQELPGLNRKALEEAAAAYAEGANSYPAKDEVLANYLMWQGQLLMRDSPRNVARARKLADQATEAAPHCDAALFLEGLTLTSEGEETTDRKQALPYLDKAVNKLTQAIQVSASKQIAPELLPAYYEVRSRANVLRANYLHGAKGEQAIGTCREYLQQARADAEKVLKEIRPRNLTDAYIAQGNALEDLAWLCHEESLWDPALDAFGNAIRESHSLNPVPLVSHGRTNYKRFRYGSNKQSDLAAAEKDLATACDVSQLSHNKDAEAEARIWLGQVYLAMNDGVKAASSILQGIKLATGGWLGYSRHVVESEIATAASLKDPRQAFQLFAAAHEHCRLLRERNAGPRPELVDLLARSWVAEAKAYQRDGKPAEARTALDQALTAYDKELAGKHQANVEDVKLLLGRSLLVLSNPELEREDLKRDEASSVADALEAAKLSAEGKLDSGLKAQAYYQAGWGYYDKGLIDELDDSWSNALKNFREAISAAPANPDSWRWRNYAGMACLRLMLKSGRNTQTGQEYEQKARGYFTEVQNDPNATDSARKEAEAYLGKLSR